MATNLSFAFVYLLLIHLVYTELLFRPRKLNEQSKTTLRNYRSEFFNEVRSEYWDRRAFNPVEIATTCDLKKIAAVNRNALCKPRPYIVALTKPEGFVMIEPSFVEVMRCEHGKCSTQLAHHCLPLEKQLKKVSVLAFNQKNRLTCLVMQVEEHASCKCGCLITEKHCQKHQIYSKTNCRCECPNQSEAHACEQNGFNWSLSSCRRIDRDMYSRAQHCLRNEPQAVNRLRDPSELTGGGISLMGEEDGYKQLEDFHLTPGFQLYIDTNESLYRESLWHRRW
uniref:Platelet-derived growth factor (PDGF) family profile domain-containing protein n=1 Tax=Daphnia galeata TaxID=27404 RepID=A0A8J2RYZ6_9CRUS|nr:unnamed protein product [Daphnia galeata]